MIRCPVCSIIHYKWIFYYRAGISIRCKPSLFYRIYQQLILIVIQEFQYIYDIWIFTAHIIKMVILFNSRSFAPTPNKMVRINFSLNIFIAIIRFTIILRRKEFQKDYIQRHFLRYSKKMYVRIPRNNKSSFSIIGYPILWNTSNYLISNKTCIE